MMARRSMITAGLLVAFLLLQPPTFIQAASSTVDEVSKQLMCQCGCSMVLETCNCGVADDMRGVIRTKLDEGQTPGQVLNYFVDKYGRKVLAAPTKRGFDLTAWLTPFAALIAAGVLIWLLLRRWVGRGRARMIFETEETSELDADYVKRLKEELADDI